MGKLTDEDFICAVCGGEARLDPTGVFRHVAVGDCKLSGRVPVIPNVEFVAKLRDEIAEATKLLEGAAKVLLGERHVWEAAILAARGEVRVFQDIVSWQPGESRNALIAAIEDRIATLQPPAMGLPAPKVERIELVVDNDASWVTLHGFFNHIPSGTRVRVEVTTLEEPWKETL